MPRPRAPTRELFEFTNRRRAGGKCDLYRCKRCGREMLENTHRFAIHICTCKKATDEDREVAKGQLRKTKKYSMRTNNSAALLAVIPASAGCPSEQMVGQYSMSSPPTLHNSQELLMPPPPTPMRRVNDYQSQQNKLDIFDCHLDSTATVFDTLPRAMTTPTLFDFEDHCRMAAASNLFDSHRRYYHPNPVVSTHQMAADGGMIFDNHHPNLNACSGMTFDQRPAHHTLMPRQRHEMPLPSYRHERQWRGSIYSTPFESRPESARSMGGLQPHMF